MRSWILLLHVAAWSSEGAAFSAGQYKSSSQIFRRKFAQSSQFVSHGAGIPPVIGPRCSVTALSMVTAAHIDSSDPFEVLGLDPNDRDSLDKKVVKRAYKRLALKYHPDVVLNRESSEKERKEASDRFAKINAAYETLIGKRNGGFGAAGSSSSSSSASSGWTPPHRRKPGDRSSSSSSSSGSYGGVNWEDFMPKYDESQYDSGGDSFGAIFADLLSGAAGAAGSYAGRGSGGFFQDFVEFLEQNVDGYGFSTSGRSSAGGGRDADLDFLLQTGNVDDIANEMDDTDLVVQQLTTKLNDIEDEIFSIKADMAASTRFSVKIELEEREAECDARKKVIEKYLKQARSRLLALQTRYKQLIAGGANDSKAGGRSRGSRTWDTTPSSGATSTRSSNPGASAGASRQRDSNDPEESWRTEGFGSSGRGRGSGRRRARDSSRTRQAEQPATSETSRPNNYQSNSASSTSSASTTSSSSTGTYRRSSQSSTASPVSSSSSYNSQSNVPPHRRTKSSSTQDDKQRLRDLKVDDEFEKLKKELGL